MTSTVSFYFLNGMPLPLSSLIVMHIFSFHILQEIFLTVLFNRRTDDINFLINKTFD